MSLKIVKKKEKEVYVVKEKEINENTLILREKKIQDLLDVIEDGGSLLDEIIYKNVYEDIMYILSTKGEEGQRILNILTKNKFSITFH